MRQIDGLVLQLVFVNRIYLVSLACAVTATVFSILAMADVNDDGVKSIRVGPAQVASELAPLAPDPSGFERCIELCVMTDRRHDRNYCAKVACRGYLAETSPLSRIQTGQVVSPYQICTGGCGTSGKFTIPQCRVRCDDLRTKGQKDGPDHDLDALLETCMKNGGRQSSCTASSVIAVIETANQASAKSALSASGSTRPAR